MPDWYEYAGAPPRFRDPILVVPHGDSDPYHLLTSSAILFRNINVKWFSGIQTRAHPFLHGASYRNYW
jgi:hypothetical protein